MSQEKAQLIAPLGNMTVPGVTATGVITATSFEGNIAGSASSIKQGSSVSAGVVTASSFAGNLTGNIQRLADSAPNISVGVVTATSFSGNLTGSVTDLTSAPAITVGVVTATTLKGPVTGNITGNVSGTAGGLGVNYNGGWTGAGTSQISVGVITATFYHGDGSNLDGVSSGPVSQQSINIDGTSATTVIDLSAGNLIYITQSADTIVSFANSENGNVYIVRTKDDTSTARNITWPASISWDGGTEPTLLNNPRSNDAQVFLLVTRNMGVEWYGKEVVEVSPQGNNQLWSWGYNTDGQMGQNNRTTYSSPIQVGSGSVWNRVNSGERQTYGIKDDGTLWVWGGDDGGGAIGLNQPTNTKYSSPVQIPGTTWSSVKSTTNTTLAVKTDGTLWGWGGSYSYGDLGLNDVVKRSSPTQVPGTTWDSLGRGRFFSNAIKTDGTLWAWGKNRYGNLGQNTVASPVNHGMSSPVQIAGTTWAAISSAGASSLATKTDGTLWTWGENGTGNLGLNQAEAQVAALSSPAQIPGTTWNAVSCSYQRGYATKTDGTLWVWGYNQYGTLGLNQPNSPAVFISSPTQIPGTTWSAIVPIDEAMLASKTDGTLWSWGRNYKGQLGQNQTGDDNGLSSPTQIPGTNWNITHGKQTGDPRAGNHISWLRL